MGGDFDFSGAGSGSIDIDPDDGDRITGLGLDPLLHELRRSRVTFIHRLQQDD